MSERRFRVVLVKPSQYDDDGFVLRHWLGTVPSNTLCAIHGLVHDAAVERRILGDDVETTVELYDETVHRIPIARIIRQSREPDTRTLVLLCGVQSAQFERGSDIARELREAGVDVLIGGFHVSGSLTMLPIVSDEIQRLLDLGVTVVKGEIERGCDELIHAGYRSDLKRMYDYIDDLPDLSDAAMPRLTKSYFGRFPYGGLATLDAGRGCPFRCSFCTIINVQGRTMRSRRPATIVESMRRNFVEHGVVDYLITDDNFARNPNWESILDGMIRLREEDGIPIRYMMETDTLAHRLPGFVDKAARAGCFQNFMGMESINPKSLAVAQKRQNRPADYAEMIAKWRDRGVVTQVGYIIGFPDDDYESVMHDVHVLEGEVMPDLASFFVLTPLPGSADHLAMWKAGVPMPDDMNCYDTAHAIVPHPKMAREEWMRAYWGAWESFYRYDNMRAILQRIHPRAYQSAFGALLWYRQAALLQRKHPLAAGFWRKRDRGSRRPGFPRETRSGALWRQLRDNATSARRALPMAVETVRLLRETRPRRGAQELPVAAHTGFSITTR